MRAQYAIILILLSDFAMLGIGLGGIWAWIDRCWHKDGWNRTATKLGDLRRRVNDEVWK